MLSKKDVSKLRIFSITLSLTSHNSPSETLGPILIGPNESEELSDSFGYAKLWPSVFKRELRDVKGRVAENGVSVDTSSLLDSAEVQNRMSV